MTTVYVLHHSHTLADGSDEVKLIGVFSASELADAAVVRLKAQPGFAAHPEGFEIDAYPVDATFWGDGFVEPEEAIASHETRS